MALFDLVCKVCGYKDSFVMKPSPNKDGKNICPRCGLTKVKITERGAPKTPLIPKPKKEPKLEPKKEMEPIKEPETIKD